MSTICSNREQPRWFQHAAVLPDRLRQLQTQFELLWFYHKYINILYKYIVAAWEGEDWWWHTTRHTHSSSSLLWLWLTSRRCQNFLEAVRVHGNGQESTSLLIRHIKGRQKVLEPPALSEECRSVCDLRDFSPYWVVYSIELDIADIVLGTERSRTPWYGIQHLHLVVELLSDSLFWNQGYRQVTSDLSITAH